ncbi:putative RING/FYVE/PHD zinc finger protein [Quillaja saponaria]|nr:putative RING/FYVE/PHD zinc finger protein [Quillaja saponaria]
MSFSSASARHLGRGGSICESQFEKSSLSEIPTSKDVDAESSSPKVQSPHAQSLYDNATSNVVSNEKSAPYRGHLIDGSSECKMTMIICTRSWLRLPDIREPPLQSLSGDVTDESDTVEHDVKVCDICGDAGREDLLAICSRCSDGAEHTYCMREMLWKVPERDWLCEECKSSTESENLGQVVEGKRMYEVSSTTQKSQRLAENLEVGPAVKRQALEYCTASPKESSPKRIAALPRESSFRSLDKGQVKPGHQMSFRDGSSNDGSGTPCSPTTGRRGQLTNSTFLKSNSFNTFCSKPKIKLVDEVLPKKQDREHTFKDVKEGPGGMMNKSMSFKSVKSSCSNATESKFNMVSSKSAHVQDAKGLKLGKEWKASDRKNLPKVDCHMVSSTMAISIVCTPKIDQKLTSRGETSVTSSMSNNRELRIAQDGKLNDFSKPSGSIARRSLESPITSVGASSTVGNASDADQKLNHINCRDDPLSNYSLKTVDRTCNSVVGTQDGLTRSPELTNFVEKTGDSLGACSGPTFITAPKSVFCKRCKETGHSTEFCMIDDLQEFGTDISAARSSREEMHESNRLKATIDAALPRRPEVYKKKGEHNVMSAETNEGKEILDNYTSGPNKYTTINDVSQLQPITDSHSSKLRNTDSSNLSAGKPIVKDLLNEASALVPVPLKISTIPVYEYIWQGVFEVRRDGKPLNFCGGIQAHLSTCASPKVPEVVNKIPYKVSLDEVPRSSTWPLQFHQNGVKEDNIALYFFAKDVESYESSYKSLLDHMIKNDLALKGFWDGVELLIFPSNQLPEESQRWNMLFYLWGVFKGRRVNHSDSSDKFLIPNLDVMPLEKDFPTAVMTLSESCCSLERKGEGSIALDRTCNVVLASNATAPAVFMKECHFEHGVETLAKLSPEALGTNGSSRTERMTMDFNTSFKQENRVSPIILSLGSQETGALGSASKEKFSDKMNSNEDQLRPKRELDLGVGHVVTGVDSHRDLSMEKVNSWQRKNKKRPHIDLSETVTLASAPTCQRMFWNDILADGEEASKKLKTGFSGISRCSSSRGVDSFSDSFASLGNDLGSCSSVEDKQLDEVCHEKIIHEDLGTKERYFFPVNSHNLNDSQLGHSSMSLKGLSPEYEEQGHDVFPNLELALGAERKPVNKGMLPFFVGVVNEKFDQDKHPDSITNEREEGGVAASLSLSLSFPSSDNGQHVKPVSKLEQLLPKRHRANSSVPLFGGFADK